MINYYRSSARQSPKHAEAQLRPLSTPTLVIWGNAIATWAQNSPSPTTLMCPTSTAWSACPTRRTGCITTRLWPRLGNCWVGWRLQPYTAAFGEQLQLTPQRHRVQPDGDCMRRPQRLSGLGRERPAGQQCLGLPPLRVGGRIRAAKSMPGHGCHLPLGWIRPLLQPRALPFPDLIRRQLMGRERLAPMGSAPSPPVGRTRHRRCVVLLSPCRHAQARKPALRASSVPATRSSPSSTASHDSSNRPCQIRSSARSTRYMRANSREVPSARSFTLLR